MTTASSSLRRISPSARDVISPSLLAFIALSLAALALSLVAARGVLLPGDRAVADALQQTPGGSALEYVADILATWPVETALVVVALAIAVRARSYALFVTLALVLVLRTLNMPMKELIERERPPPADLLIREPAPGYGFPSGHAYSAVLFGGFFMAAAARHLHGAAAAVALAAGAAYIAIIGFDRVWDGAHWPSDVLGGAAIGAWLLVLAAWLPEAAWRAWPSRAVDKQEPSF